jgi:predicted  nucleic acid-binding Zn-ribbon protein
MIFNWIANLTKSYQVPETYELLVTDKDGEKHSLVGLCASLAKEVVRLEERITKLEGENVELTNCLYEVENRLQAQIDNIHPVIYNLQSHKLDT